jgi:hypothetical protein
MNISFNVNDDKGNAFISASKWIIDDPLLTDDQNVNKCLKKYMARAIDDHIRHTALVTYELAVEDLKTQNRALTLQVRQAIDELAAQKAIADGAPSTEVA